MKKKTLSMLFAVLMAFSLTACVDSSEQQDETGMETEADRDMDALTQGDDTPINMTDDGYEIVDKINIDSGDTKLEYLSHEKFTLESGEEIVLVNFTFTNVSSGQTSVDAHYNFTAFQDGVEITAYSTLFDEVEGDTNRAKEILDGASIDISVGIAPDNWESPIQLRVNDEMAYDDVEVTHYYQEQEITLK